MNCEICQKDFKTNQGLKRHLESSRHNFNKYLKKFDKIKNNQIKSFLKDPKRTKCRFERKNTPYDDIMKSLKNIKKNMNEDHPVSINMKNEDYTLEEGIKILEEKNKYPKGIYYLTLKKDPLSLKQMKLL